MGEDLIYIGDGVYVAYHGFDVELRTMRDQNYTSVKHFIHLEPEAVQELVTFLRAKGWDIK